MISCFSTECAYLYLLERQHAEHEVLVLNGIQRTKHLLSLFDLIYLFKSFARPHQPSPYY